jgi:hypothetical protein
MEQKRQIQGLNEYELPGWQPLFTKGVLSSTFISHEKAVRRVKKAQRKITEQFARKLFKGLGCPKAERNVLAKCAAGLSPTAGDLAKLQK